VHNHYCFRSKSLPASTDATRLPNIHRKCKHFPVKVGGKSAMVPNSMARHVMKLDPWHAVIIKQFYFTNVIKFYNEYEYFEVSLQYRSLSHQCHVPPAALQDALQLATGLIVVTVVVVMIS
jgi:hypothetical protein